VGKDFPVRLSPHRYEKEGTLDAGGGGENIRNKEDPFRRLTSLLFFLSSFQEREKKKTGFY
jgi:hypothetical protein